MESRIALVTIFALSAACFACTAAPDSSRDTAAPRASLSPSTRERPKLVGIWRITRFCDDDDAGKLYDPLGPNPTGFFVYSPTGQLLIQAMRAPPIQPFAAGDLSPNDAERRALFDSYFGYFGTYTITSESTVVHHVRGGTSPSFIGTDQVRVYRIRGDTLAIGGSRRTWPCRVLIRVE